MLFPQYMFRRRRGQGSTISCAILATAVLSTTIIAFMPTSASANASKSNIQTVRHGDLDLASDKDVIKVQRRIGQVAKQLCSQPGIAADILKRQINDCVEETKAEALRDLDQNIAMLTSAVRPESRN